MSTQILMPALSPTMEEGKLAKWLVKEGDTVKSGDILAEIETDKATMEFEAVDEGRIGAILVPEGTEGVKVGTVIATIGEGTVPAAPAPAPVAEPAPVPAAKAEPAPVLSNTQTITVREALRDAMAEEMRRDDRVFLLGEESLQPRIRNVGGNVGRKDTLPGFFDRIFVQVGGEDLQGEIPLGR